LELEKNTKKGWGEWTGKGTTLSKKSKQKRKRKIKEIMDARKEKRGERKDSSLGNVIISERRMKARTKYEIHSIPRFTNVSDLKKDLNQPLGPDWNSMEVVQAETRPDVNSRPGVIIQPLKLPKTHRLKHERRMKQMRGGSSSSRGLRKNKKKM